MNNYLNQQTFSKNEELLKEIDLLKIELKRIEEIIQEHMKYINFHNLQVDGNLKKDEEKENPIKTKMRDINRLNLNPEMYKIHLKSQNSLLEDELNLVEKKNDNLKNDILKFTNEIKKLKQNNLKEQNKFEDFDLEERNKKRKKIERLKIKEMRLKTKIEEILETPFFKKKKSFFSNIDKNDKLLSENTVLKQKQQKENILYQNLEKEINEIKLEIEKTQQHIEETEKNIIHCDVLKEKAKNTPNEIIVMNENEDIFKKILDILKYKNDSKSFIEKNPQQKLEKILMEIDHFEKELVKTKSDFLNNKIESQNKELFLEMKEKNDFLLQKYEKDNQILFQLIGLFFEKIKEKKIGYHLKNNTEFIYTEGGEIFDEDALYIIENNLDDDNFENKNILEIYIDEFIPLSDFDPNTQIGFIIQFLDFEDIATDLFFMKNKINFQKGFLLNFDDFNFESIIEEKIKISLISKNDDSFTELGTVYIDLWEFFRFNMLYNRINPGKVSFVYVNSEFVYENENSTKSEKKEIKYISDDDLKSTKKFNHFKNVLSQSKENIHKIPMHTNDEMLKILGVLDFRIRFKFPIEDLLIKEMEKCFKNQRKKKLKIKIYQGFNFQEEGRYYVNFEFLKKNYITKTVFGKNPIFDFEVHIESNNILDIEKNKLNLIIFDDAKDFDDFKDFYGKLEIDLKELKFKNKISSIFSFDNEKKVLVSVFWENKNRNNFEIYKDIFDEYWFGKKFDYLVNHLKTKKNAFNFETEKSFNKKEFLELILDSNEELIKLGKNEFFLSPLEYLFFWENLKKKFGVENTSDFCLSSKDIKNLFLAEEEIPIDKEKKEKIKEKDFEKKFENNLEILLAKFKTNLRNYTKSQNVDIFGLIKKFDENLDNNINFEEFKNISNLIDCKFTDDEVSIIFFCLDRSGDGNLDSIEFLKINELSVFDIIHDRRTKVIYEKFKEFKKDEILRKYLENIKNFIQKNKISYLKFYDVLKLKKKDKILRKDFKNINQQKLQIILKEEDANLIFNEIDKNKNGDIDFDELCRFIRLDEVFYILNNSKNKTELESNKFVKITYDLIMDEKMNVEKFVTIVDENKDGYLDRIELFNFFKMFFKKKLENFEVKEFERFLSLLDQSKDGVVEVKEIKLILESYEKILSTPNQPNEFFLQNLLKKLKELIDEFYYKLKINFETKEDDLHYVKLDEFFKEIKKYVNFSIEELETIRNPILLPFTKFNRINYINFLELEKFYQKDFEFLEKVDKKEKHHEAIEVFKIIKNIGFKYGYDKFLLFSLFDVNKNGYISPQDIFRVFKEIDLDLKLDQIQNGFDFMDLNNDSKINLTEFCTFLEKLK